MTMNKKAVALDFNKCNSFYFSNCVNSYTFTFSFRKKLSFVSLITIPINITTKPQTILGVMCSSGQNKIENRTPNTASQLKINELEFAEAYFTPTFISKNASVVANTETYASEPIAESEMLAGASSKSKNPAKHIINAAKN